MSDQELQEARRAILNIQEEIRRDLAKEKELKETRDLGCREFLQEENNFDDDNDLYQQQIPVAQEKQQQHQYLAPILTNDIKNMPVSRNRNNFNNILSYQLH